MPAAPAYPDLSAKVKELEANAAALSAKATATQQQATELAGARLALQREVETLRAAAATPVAPAYPDLR